MTMFSGFTPALVMVSTQPLTRGVMHSSFHRAWTIPMRSFSAPGNEVGAGAGPLMLAMLILGMVVVVGRGKEGVCVTEMMVKGGWPSVHQTSNAPRIPSEAV